MQGGFLMTMVTVHSVCSAPAAGDTDSINLYKLGMLFVVKCRY